MITTSQLQDAAARVSSGVTSFSRGPKGATSSDATWRRQQEKIARALVADPDIVTYFAYLASNRACALAQSVAAQASALVVLAEGWKYAQAPVAEPAKLKGTLGTMTTRSTFSSEDVARVTADVNSYVAKTLLPQVTKNGRTQVRGDEASAQYAQQRTVLAGDWKRLVQALTAFSQARMVSPIDLRNLALAAPVAALQTTADLLDPARLTEFTVQLAAAGAAVGAMGRVVDLKTRLRVGADDLPGGVTATLSGTTLTLSVSPLQLGIKSGDVVSWGTDTVVNTADDTSLTLAAAVTGTGVLRVLSTPYVTWETAIAALAPSASLLPGADVVTVLREKEGDRSAARIRVLMEYLVKLATILDTASADALASLSRAGGEAFVLDGTTSVAAQLRAFAPLLGAKTKKVGDAILGGLEADGFDYAVEQLYRGDVTAVLSQVASRASRVGRVTSSASTLGK